MSYTVISPISDFNRLVDAVFNDDFMPSNTIRQTIASGDSYPKSDISFDTKSEDYIIDIEVPGCDESNISSIDYKEGYITIKGSTPKRDENRKYAKTGIKRVTDWEQSYAIDIDKYDISKLDAKLDKGLLTIRIPVKKNYITSKSFTLNGKKLSEKTE